MKGETNKNIKLIGKDRCINPHCEEKANGLYNNLPYCEKHYDKIKPRRRPYRMPRGAFTHRIWKKNGFYGI